MTPISWPWATVWVYALLWFVVEDQGKITTGRWLVRHSVQASRQPSEDDLHE